MFSIIMIMPKEGTYWKFGHQIAKIISPKKLGADALRYLLKRLS